MKNNPMNPIKFIGCFKKNLRGDKGNIKPAGDRLRQGLMALN
jgi:hypothetical protein